MNSRYIICLFIIIISCETAFSQSCLRPRGDVNCDWEVNISDVDSLLEDMLKGTPYHSFYTYAQDVSNDKEINITDLNMIIGAMLGDQLPPMPSPSGTLPVLHINTEHHRDILGKEDEDYLHADWWLDAAVTDDGHDESLGSKDEPLGMLIRGRGHYSWFHNSKKSFRIKLDTKQSLLGMKKNRHFCLLARDHWTTMFGFELSRRIGLAYTPAASPVEVILNGQYIGLYMLTEKIRVEKNRVNIVEQEDGETDEELITGGWLIEIGNHADDIHFVFQEGNGGWIGVNYHSPDSVSPQQLNYIYNYLVNTDQAIYGTVDSIGSWSDYIDMDTLACFYIVNEVADNIESFTNSLYLHKQRGRDTKLMFGPVWDMGCAYGRPELGQPCFIYENTSTVYAPHWLPQLTTYPEFQDAIVRHWNRLCRDGLDTIEDYINAMVDKMTPASRSDRVRWPEEEYKWFPDIKSKSNDYYLRQMRAKVQFLKENWGDHPQ